jgi:hypothetical protein
MWLSEFKKHLIIRWSDLRKKPWWHFSQRDHKLYKEREIHRKQQPPLRKPESNMAIQTRWQNVKKSHHRRRSDFALYYQSIFRDLVIRIRCKHVSLIKHMGTSSQNR